MTCRASKSCSFKSNKSRSGRFSFNQAMASLPEAAMATEQPSRSSAFAARRNHPTSPSTINGVACGLGLLMLQSGADFGHLDQRNEQAKLLYRLRKFFIIPRLDHVIAATQRVAMFHFARVIRGREHDDRNFP